MPDETDFQPTEIWTPESSSFDFGEAIEAGRREMNSKNPDKLIHDLGERVQKSESGIVYAVLKGEHPKQYSDTDALVVFNPFANKATKNMLVRAEFIREVAQKANIRDESGKLKPVIMLTSPGLHGSKLKLTHKERKAVAGGNFGPAAREYLKTVSALSYGRVALLGYSQGADLALAGANESKSANIDASSITIGEPSGVEKRNLPTLAKDFFTAAPDLEVVATKTDLRALDSARGLRSDYAVFLASAVYPMNWFTFARGLGGSKFEVQMQQVIDSGGLEKIVVAYGSKSTITPSRAIEPSLARLHEQVNDHRLTSIKVMGGTHAWGEQLTVLAKLYLQALS